MNLSHGVSYLAQFARKTVQSVQRSNMALLQKVERHFLKSNVSTGNRALCCGHSVMLPVELSMSVVNDECEAVPVPGQLALALPHIHSAALPVVQSPSHPICPDVFPQATHIPKSLHLKSDLHRWTWRDHESVKMWKSEHIISATAEATPRAILGNVNSIWFRTAACPFPPSTAAITWNVSNYPMWLTRLLRSVITSPTWINCRYRDWANLSLTTF